MKLTSAGRQGRELEFLQVWACPMARLIDPVGLRGVLAVVRLVELFSQFFKYNRCTFERFGTRCGTS